MGSWSKAECPHCRKVIPLHLVKKIYPERKFIPARPTLACPVCGGTFKNSMNNSGWFTGALGIVVAAQIPRLLGHSLPPAITVLVLLLAFLGLIMAAKTNQLVADDRPVERQVRRDTAPLAKAGLTIWTLFKQIVCGTGVLLCLLVFWVILRDFVAAPSFWHFMGILATALVGAMIYIFGFVSWSRLLGKE